MEYKKTEVGVGSVRRSQRQKKAVVVTTTRDMHLIDDIIIGDSDKEEEERNEARPETGGGGGGKLEEKVDNIFQLLEAQQKFIDVFNSKGFKRNFMAEGGAAGAEGDLNYKSLYIDSQKKVEALMEENRQLAIKLERARGQIEVYEKGSLVSEVLDKLKDFMALSSLTKVTDASLNLSSKAIRGTGVAQGAGLEGKSPPKRKRLGKAVNSIK